MEASPDRIFISYSRGDGREFAETFECRLEREGIHSWRDLKSMQAGDIRPQVLRAIEDAKHFVLILSRRALNSVWIKREWSHARMMGKRVSPVLADPAIKRADLPPWMRREEVFDIDPLRDRGEERWKALVLVLHGDGRTKRAPYMPGDLPSNFVPRPAEYAALKAAVLAPAPEKTVGLTTALRGAGGYGKTTLMNYLCYDPDVRFEFSDGIVRVEIGKERLDVTGLMLDLIEKIAPDAKRPGFQDPVTASAHLAELIGEGRMLLIIDDVWREAQLRPFLRGGLNCVRLVTTRLSQVLPASHVLIPIDEMRAAEASSLISANLPESDQPAVKVRLAALAKRLGNWPQMLAIANGWMRDRVLQGEVLKDAIAKFERRLSKRGLTDFDPEDSTQRDQAIRACVEASLEDLNKEKIDRLGELAILPEDETVPLHAIEDLWSETGDLDLDETDDLVRRLQQLSLLQNLDLGARTLRLHDNMMWYLRDKLGAEGCCTAHAAMVRALQARCGGDWETLPLAYVYSWRFLIRHLRGAGQNEEADRLLTGYTWIRAKLRAFGARSLFDSYLPESHDEGAQLIGRAIALSLPVLAINPHELPRQVFGRLGRATNQAACALVASAQQDPDFRPAPLWPGLTPPSAERLRLVGHASWVWSASFSPDGARVVTASMDDTVRLWDAATGEETTVLRGHAGAVRSASFSPDGARLLTASDDGTARLWDATTGEETAVLRGHTDTVWSASFSPDGARVVTASFDGTARLWDAATGEETPMLRDHVGRITSASFSPDGARLVTASSDGTARLWDAATGEESAVLQQGTHWVGSVSFSLDGARVVTASMDGTARLWDAATGEETAVLRGHAGGVGSATFSPDGARIVTTSDDGTARLWDAATGEETAVLRGHAGEVQRVSFSPDGARLVTASLVTARLWDAATGEETAVLRGHVGRITSASFSPDGARLLTASGDKTARLWDAVTVEETGMPRGHAGAVRSASFSPDGARLLTASDDGTARTWDAATGEETAVLRGHTNTVWSASFSPDGAGVVTASFDGTARLWDAATGRETGVLRGHGNWVRSASFSPDGARVLTASEDGTARLWDAARGKETIVLRHATGVHNASFSLNGARVLTESGGGVVQLWDAATGEETSVLRGDAAWVESASFSPDGARVLTAPDDGTVRLWDAARGEEIAQIFLDAPVNALCLHGSMIALGDKLGRIHVFEAGEFPTLKVETSIAWRCHGHSSA